MLRKNTILFFLTLSYTCSSAIGIEQYKYILNDPCINKFYTIASSTIKDNEIKILKEAIGLIIRFEIENPIEEYYRLSYKTIRLLQEIEFFLAKIKKSAIIEVHTEVFVPKTRGGIRNWELSTVIANNIESYIIQNSSTITKDNIKSVGYGEFKPAKNTPNNGGKYSNRIDIIIPCSINGE